MFASIRVQILYPCRGSCAWCSTHRKNPLFAQLYRDGVSRKVHEFYVDVVQRLKPSEVILSGGEPLLYPELAWFLNAIRDSTERIKVFCSYQYAQEDRNRIPWDQFPLEKVTVCHTAAYFEPGHWHKLTRGFPFELYVENIRALVRCAVRKRFKFILNHAMLGQELTRFQELVRPDRECELSFKVINDQADGLNESAIERTRALVSERTHEFERLAAETGWGRVVKEDMSLEVVAPLLEDADVEKCGYRHKPLELRFALDKANDAGQVLKYRYCPYFPPDFGHRFHIDRDDPQTLVQNYYRGPFRAHCSECRFLKYCRPTPNGRAALGRIASMSR